MLIDATGALLCSKVCKYVWRNLVGSSPDFLFLTCIGWWPCLLVCYFPVDVGKAEQIARCPCGLLFSYWSFRTTQHGLYDSLGPVGCWHWFPTLLIFSWCVPKPGLLLLFTTVLVFWKWWYNVKFTSYLLSYFLNSLSSAATQKLHWKNVELELLNLLPWTWKPGWEPVPISSNVLARVLIPTRTEEVEHKYSLLSLFAML